MRTTTSTCSGCSYILAVRSAPTTDGRRGMDQQMEVYIFYFDVIGVVKEYLRDPGVLHRLTDFQRGVRGHPLGLGAEWTYVVTLYDNIWARISANEMHPDHKVLELAARA